MPLPSLCELVLPSWPRRTIRPKNSIAELHEMLAGSRPKVDLAVMPPKIAHISTYPRAEGSYPVPRAPDPNLNTGMLFFPRLLLATLYPRLAYPIPHRTNFTKSDQATVCLPAHSQNYQVKSAYPRAKIT